MGASTVYFMKAVYKYPKEKEECVCKNVVAGEEVGNVLSKIDQHKFVLTRDLAAAEVY